MNAITYPRKRHCHRCPLCQRSVACYKKQCSKGPRITVHECPWHRPARSPYGIAGPGREYEANPDPRTNPQVQEQIRKQLDREYLRVQGEIDFNG